MEELKKIESEKARLSPGVCLEPRIYYPDAILEIGGDFYHIRISGKAKSLWDILRQWNGLSNVRSALEHFGYTLADCYKGSPEQVFAFFLERFAGDLSRIKRDGNEDWIESRWEEWEWLREQAEGLPQEIRDLLGRACQGLSKESARLCFAWLNECDF